MAEMPATMSATAFGGGGVCTTRACNARRATRTWRRECAAWRLRRRASAKPVLRAGVRVPGGGERRRQCCRCRSRQCRRRRRCSTYGVRARAENFTPTARLPGLRQFCTVYNFTIRPLRIFWLCVYNFAANLQRLPRHKSGGGNNNYDKYNNTTAANFTTAINMARAAAHNANACVCNAAVINLTASRNALAAAIRRAANTAAMAACVRNTNGKIKPQRQINKRSCLPVLQQQLRLRSGGYGKLRLTGGYGYPITVCNKQCVAAALWRPGGSCLLANYEMRLRRKFCYGLWLFCNFCYAFLAGNCGAKYQLADKSRRPGGRVRQCARQ